MIDAGEVREIRKQYEKHGWTLRRVLLCSDVRENPSFPALEDLFGGATLVDAAINAAWFSRRAANGNESWELRRLAGAPFALLKVFAADTDEPERERIRRETESAMSSKA